MPTPSPTKNKSRQGPTGKSAAARGRPTEAPVEREIRLLAKAVAAFAEHAQAESWQERRTTSIAQTVFLIGRVVPRSNRLDALREIQKIIEASIKAAELEEASSLLPVAGKVLPENAALMDQMRNQSLSARQKDIASKKLLTSGEIADRLHCTPAAVAASVRSHRMFSLTGPGGKYYPAFFADEKYDRGVLEKVSKALGKVSGGSKWEFFMSQRHSPDGKTPLDALAKGDVEVVLAAAAAFKNE